MNHTEIGGTMKGRIENKLGTVMIDPEVIAMFAAIIDLPSDGFAEDTANIFFLFI